ncbi:hypothetical protein M9H77_07721 [Catharanthus roseus]|uniref:Uncharacterized protein n=1 Tax=Catharanthus roseus TaxID=4058 RepID=A0ACC0BVS5_CATRO|nr:hypothetical protein M9H77_07721 [Catharanthus roseus]
MKKLTKEWLGNKLEDIEDALKPSKIKDDGNSASVGQKPNATDRGKEHILERLFIDLVAGESLIKERAVARFNDLVVSTDVVAGEPLLLLPRYPTTTDRPSAKLVPDR